MTRIPALDGLRAVAIAMVIGYHVDKGVVPAGHWGVLLFFVLSGFLVTRLLVAERDQKGGIDLWRFYVKRLLRLGPALLLVCTALLVTGNTDWTRAGAALGFYANYARIEGLGLGLLTHTWFLSVLAHFYVVWPLVIAAVPARLRRRTIIGLTVVAAAWRVIAILVMSPAWVYNSTDANAVALLAGCWLAVADHRPNALDRWAIPAFLGLMFVPAFGDTGDALLWGGFIAIAVAVLATRHALEGPEWLAHPVAVWAGSISYGLYLWHYVFVRSDMSAWIALPLSLAIAVVSWYLVERPIQRYGRRLTRSRAQEA